LAFAAAGPTRSDKARCPRRSRICCRGRAPLFLILRGVVRSDDVDIDIATKFGPCR
jgi:hypothetical protein